jgi:hypothetical protein
MQVPEQFHSEPFAHAPAFVIMDKFPESFVRLLVYGQDGTPVTFHALLLVCEMDIGIVFQVIHQLKQEIRLLLGGMGEVQQFFQKIDVVNQQPVLLVQSCRTGLELFCPLYHNLEFNSAVSAAQKSQPNISRTLRIRQHDRQ